MKALTFIDFYKQVIENPLYPAYFGENNKPSDKIQAYYELVSQPFTPEMIEIIFEGWTVSNFTRAFSNISLYFNEDTRVSITVEKYKNLTTMLLETDKILFPSRKKMPLTLNDFIFHCEEAGIELHFKDTIFQLSNFDVYATGITIKPTSNL